MFASELRDVTESALFVFAAVLRRESGLLLMLDPESRIWFNFSLPVILKNYLIFLPPCLV